MVLNRVIARNPVLFVVFCNNTHEFFSSTLKLGNQFLRKLKNMTNICTLKMRVTTKGNSLKNSLSRRTKKVPNLKKIGTLMFKLVKNSKNK